MYEYLKDKEFLQKLEDMNVKTQYVKLTILDFAEKPVREIQGQVQSGGTINVNGSSSLRRTLSFTMFADVYTNDLTNLDNLISLNKKIKVEIGYKNLIKNYEHYGDIIWFKAGTYVIATASIANTVTGSNINIQAKDKMVMLNGMAGGTIPSTIVLDKRYEYQEMENGETVVVVTYPTLYQIIRELIEQYGGEPINNIVISDLEQTGKMLIRYIGNKKFYLKKDLSTWKEADQNPNPAEYYEYVYGQDIGYQETDFTFPGELTFAAGTTVTQILDKICQTFGNFEYFYDLDGRFIFQEKKNYLNNAYTPIVEVGTKQYIKQFYNTKYSYTFNNNKNVISINSTPKYENIKNDFVIWGTKTMASGVSIQIRYHLAIDTKPQIELANKYMYERTSDQGVLLGYTFLNSKGANTEKLIGAPAKDWREELYRQALLRQLDGVTPEAYDMELLAEWRKLYDPTNNEWRTGTEINGYDYWNPIVSTNPGGLHYWLDFLDDGEDLRKYSCAAIGRRTKVVNSDKITSIFNSDVKDILFVENNFNDDYYETYENNKNAGLSERNRKIQELNSKGQNFVFFQPNQHNLFSGSATGASAYDILRETIFQHLIYNTTVQISCSPIYYLEPNNVININNNNNGLSGDYIINSFTLPLNYNGVMQITATEAINRI